MNSASQTARFGGLMVLVAALFAAGCSSESGPVTSNKSKYEVADSQSAGNAAAGNAAAGNAAAGNAAAGAAPAAVPPAQGAPLVPQHGAVREAPLKPSTQPPAVAAPTAPASDSPQDLLAFIQILQNRQPSGNSREAMIADFSKSRETILETAQRLLKHPEADTATLMMAAQSKMSSLSELSQLGVANAAERLEEFCTSLRDHPNPEVATLGRRVSFATRVDALQEGQLEDVQQIVADFDELLSGQQDEQLVMMGSQVATILEGSGHTDEAVHILEKLGKAVAASGDEQLAEQANMLLEQAEILRLGVRSKFSSLVQGEANSAADFMAAARKLLTSERRGRVTVGLLLQQAAFTLEAMEPEAAAELFRLLEEAYQQHEDQELVEYIDEALTKYKRRASLLGQPFVVEGVTVEGQPFDWSDYQGKVVLVDFWATWCGPCLREFPNLKRNYEQFRDQGFEVVGVNLDDDPQSLQQFFSLQQLPWPTVVSQDPEARGMEMPLAAECGVEFIPFIVLVGRDGKVAALNVRGEELGPKLSELLAVAPPPAGSQQSQHGSAGQVEPRVAGRPAQ